jgi:hypothetical protein
MDELRLLVPELKTSTPAILVALGIWTEDDDRELPRRGYGYKPEMTSNELYDSARAWWHLDEARAADYGYLVAVHDRVTRGVWQIDHSSWRRASPETCRRLGRSRSRWSLEAWTAEPEVEAAFVGRAIPETRADGRSVFGSGAVVAYWPA